MFRLEIDTSGDAFADTPATELARLLRQVAKRAYDGDCTGTLVDINGNTCGRYWVAEGPEQLVDPQQRAMAAQRLADAELLEARRHMDAATKRLAAAEDAAARADTAALVACWRKEDSYDQG